MPGRLECDMYAQHKQKGNCFGDDVVQTVMSTFLRAALFQYHLPVHVFFPSFTCEFVKEYLVHKKFKCKNVCARLIFTHPSSKK